MTPLTLVDPLQRWLAGPFGMHLIEQEKKVVAAALESVFGAQCVQIGHWGGEESFLPLVRIPRRGLVAEPGSSGDCVSHASSLALLSQSVDAVLLPHTLEFEPEPHEVLREAERVLVGEGHLIILGFAPAGFWALRHYLSGDGFPPSAMHFLSAQRLRDWLRLLGFEILETVHFVHGLPIEGLVSGPIARGLEAVSGVFGHKFGSVYCLKARKRVYALTPIRPRRRPARVLAGAVAGTTCMGDGR
jgi:SAM-dependent methyltransferase